MIPIHLDIYCQQRANELLREAQETRLVKEALAGQKARSPLRRRVLGWLGRWMVVCGWHLQQRYGPAPMAQMSRAAGHRH
jgi:hypothetical protein